MLDTRGCVCIFIAIESLATHMIRVAYLIWELKVRMAFAILFHLRSKRYKCMSDIYIKKAVAPSRF